MTTPTLEGLSNAQVDQALLPIRADLEAVSRRLLDQLTDPVARNVVYLVSAGGKRLRPALVLLAGASAPAAQRASLIDAATAVELIHTATLIHDDIIDQAPLRRAQPAFHERWGTERAVLMGDYLYSTAFTLLARLGHPAVVQILAEVCRELCRGELREVEARYRLDLTEAEYLAIIQDKTASLIGGCCRSGALIGGLPDATAQRLAAFGMKFGMAFQIIDDCLDLTGTEQDLGKSVLKDLDKGALSLPIIYLTQRLSRKACEELFAPLQARAADRAFLARVAQAAQAAGTLQQARDAAQRLITEAHALLEGVDLQGREVGLRQLADYAIHRSH
jgi:geranylgeranyl pyrophosphate synthase